MFTFLIFFTQIGPDWLCYLGSNFYRAPRIFFLFNTLVFIYFSKYKTVALDALQFSLLILLA